MGLEGAAVVPVGQAAGSQITDGGLLLFIGAAAGIILRLSGGYVELSTPLPSRNRPRSHSMVPAACWLSFNAGTKPADIRF
jgi:hypothetical protein